MSGPVQHANDLYAVWLRHCGKQLERAVYLIDELAGGLEIVRCGGVGKVPDIPASLRSNNEASAHSPFRPCLAWISRRPMFSRSSRVISVTGPLSIPS